MEKPNLEKKDLLLSISEMSKFTELNYLFNEKSLPKDFESPEAGKLFLEIHQRIYQFCDKLIKKYGYSEVIKRKLFHLIAGSTGLSEKECPYLDFEEKDEKGETKHLIEEFIKEL